MFVVWSLALKIRCKLFFGSGSSSSCLNFMYERGSGSGEASLFVLCCCMLFFKVWWSAILVISFMRWSDITTVSKLSCFSTLALAALAWAYCSEGCGLVVDLALCVSLLPLDEAPTSNRLMIPWSSPWASGCAAISDNASSSVSVRLTPVGRSYFSPAPLPFDRAVVIYSSSFCFRNFA